MTPHAYHGRAFHRANIKLRPNQNVVTRLSKVENYFLITRSINSAIIWVPILRQDLVQNGQERQVIKYIEILFNFWMADLFCHRLIGKLLLYPSNSVSHLRRSHRQTSVILFSFFLSILSRSNFDHHLRCGGWLNFEFS